MELLIQVAKEMSMDIYVQKWLQVLFYLSFLSIPFGAMSLSFFGSKKHGFTSVWDVLWYGLWCVGALSAVVNIPYMTYSTIMIYQATRPEWYSREFGDLFSAWVLIALMLFYIILPIIAIFQWRKRVKSL